MEKLILYENLGMWGKHIQVVWVVCLKQRVYIIICLRICSVLGNCGYIGGLGRVVCRMNLCVYSRSTAIGEIFASAMYFCFSVGAS